MFRQPRKAPLRPRSLRLESLEPRAMCALAPSHAVIPADGVRGATLQSDGSVEFYGYDAPLFLQLPSHFLPSYPLLVADPDQPVLPAYQWSISPDGRLLSKSELNFPDADWLRSIEAISPDGSWFAGVQSTETGDFILNGKTVIWKRGTNELMPVESPPESTGGVIV